MEENILPQTPSPNSPSKSKTALVSVFLTIALTIALIILGERILHDVNRWLNPAQNVYGYAPRGIQEMLIPTAHASEQRLGNYTATTPSVSSYSYSRQDYETYRLLLHAAVIIPLFLLVFVVYYAVHFKRKASPYRILATAYLVFAFWMIIRLLGEASWYMVRNYKTLGIYLVVGLIIAVFTTLIVIVQKRLHAKDGAS